MRPQPAHPAEAALPARPAAAPLVPAALPRPLTSQVEDPLHPNAGGGTMSEKTW